MEGCFGEITILVFVFEENIYGTFGSHAFTSHVLYGLLQKCGESQHKLIRRQTDFYSYMPSVNVLKDANETNPGITINKLFQSVS